MTSMYGAVHDLLVGSRELRVFSNGSGSPVLMLHDLGASAADFQSLASAICAADRELVAVDLPGSGHSDPIPGSDIRATAAHLIDALPQLFTEPADVLGHGFGGYLAASIAAERPDAVKALVLLDPAVPPRSGPAGSTRMPPEMALRGALTTLRAGKIRQNLSGFSRARSVLEQLSKADPAWWEQLQHIKARTLVLGNSEASPADRAVLDVLAGAIPGALRNTVAGGKRPHISAAADVAGHVLDFLTG